MAYVIYQNGGPMYGYGQTLADAILDAHEYADFDDDELNNGSYEGPRSAEAHPNFDYENTDPDDYAFDQNGYIISKRQAAAKIIGGAKTSKKAASSRQNGEKGGRPKTSPLTRQEQQREYQRKRRAAAKAKSE